MSAPCPMPPSWRRWSSGEHWRSLADDERRAARALGRVRLLTRIAVVPALWVVAPDDARLIGSPADVNFRTGYPQHDHTDVTIGGRRLHVDRAWATAGGPGRSYAECRVFEDGRLVGRGGCIGCSLGGGGSDLPARALVAPGAMLLVDLHAPLEVWSCRARR